MDTELLKRIVARDNTVQFTKYFDGQLWYKVAYYDGHGVPDDHAARFVLEFPVPVADCGTATFLAEDRAMLFLRYIRKHLEMLEKAKEEQNGQ